MLNLAPDAFATGAYFASASQHLPTILLSLALAVLASYVAVELAGRVRGVLDPASGRLWILAGSVVMGTGVWSMHFVGMAAVTYPFEARFEGAGTLASWLIAVLVAAVPISAATRERLDRRRLVISAALTGAGIAAMHFIGADALAVSIAPRQSLGWLAIAFVVATVGCGVALSIARHDRRGFARIRAQLQAASVFGGSLAVLHYMAMAATDYLPGTICTASTGLEASLLGTSVGGVTLGFLALMLLVFALERRTQRIARELDKSLNRARDDLQYVTFNDAATGLPNRLVFQDRLRQAAEHCERSERSLDVLLVEIDDFVRFSRGLDPAQIARVLREVGARLVGAAGDGASVACAGGHQFLMLTESRAGIDTQPSIQIATAIARELRVPIDIGGAQVRLAASIGISMLPADGGAGEIVGNASVAMEAARAAGGNRFAFFETAMDVDARATAEWLEQLRGAVARGELELHYQPKLHALSNRIAGVEALVRWRHPERGMVSPAVFIPLAERFGLIQQIGAWVIEEACRQMAVWADLGIRLRVAVNVSVTQLRDPTFADHVDDLLARYGVDPERLTCEITESGAMEDSDSTLAIFRRLKAAGVQISIDDFGTGYSSLSQLRKMPVRQLKIDRSFISDVATDPDARAVVQAIVDLARALRLEVVAEGVETMAQRDILLEMRCDKFQGFLFARPMPAAALTELMTDLETAQRQFRDSLFLA